MDSGAVALRRQLADTEAALAESTSSRVAALASEGYTMRDIGAVLGITHQRVHQLRSA